MNKPTHEQVTHRAEKLWQERGRPDGKDLEIWLEAERQLTTGASSNGSGTQSEAKSAVAVAEKAAQQRKEARAPMVPSKTVPKAPPPESGKPLWDKPHSS